MSDSCDPMDCSPPGSSVRGILQARILEWVAIPSPGDLPDPGIKSESPALQGNSLLTEVIHGIYKLKQVSECNSQEHLLHFSKRQQACWSVSGFYLFFISVFCPILCDLNSQRMPAPCSRRAES